MTPAQLHTIFVRSLFPSIWPFIIRVVLGALLVYHGVGKVFEGGMGKMATSLANKGWFLPDLQAFAATYTEFAGGMLLVVGLFTRPVAFANVVLFLVAFFVIHGADPFKVKEMAMLFLLMSTYVFFVGPGKASVDYFLFTKNAEPEPAEVSELPASE